MTRLISRIFKINKQDFQDFQDFQDEGLGASEWFLEQTQDYPREGQALALREAPVVRARLSANSLERKQD